MTTVRLVLNLALHCASISKHFHFHRRRGASWSNATISEDADAPMGPISHIQDAGEAYAISV